MRAETCPTCGGAADPARICPHCGAAPGSVATALSDIDREIAELAARDVAIQQQRTDLSSKIQAAMHRRTMLANAQDDRLRHEFGSGRKVARRRRVVRRAPGPLPPVAPPRQRQPPRQADDGHAPPETSSGSVQTVLLVLGALLLGVSAIVFAGLAITTLGAVTRTAILLAATIATLSIPPRLLARGLAATAETVAAVGLLMVPLVGTALWTVPGFRLRPMPGETYAALVLAVTVAVAAWYARRTGLYVPRYATLLAAQPVLPLLLRPWLPGDATWAVALAAVAAIDLTLIRLLPGRLSRWAHAPRPAPAVPSRPESDPEEADAVVSGGGAPARRLAPPAAPAEPRAPGRFWLTETGWVLYGLALTAALAFAAAALVAAGDATTLLGAGAAAVLAAGLGVAGARVAGRDDALGDAATALLTATVLAVAARAAMVGAPSQAMLTLSAVVCVGALATWAVPGSSRRGARWGVVAAITAAGVATLTAALPAANAALAAARPPWHADLDAYAGRLADAVGPRGWQVALSAALLTVAAGAALAAGRRREWLTVGVVVTALCLPASWGLPWLVGPWLPLGFAVALAAAALVAPRRRALVAHLTGAGLLALFAASASLTRPELTAAVLLVTAAAAAMVAVTARTVARRCVDPDLVADGCAALAALALPGTVAAVLSAGQAGGPARVAGVAVLVGAGLLFSAFAQVRRRMPSAALTVSGVLGALATLVMAIGMRGTTWADMCLGAVVVAAALTVPLAPLWDSRRRSDQALDGADVAAAAAVAATIAALGRAATLLTPSAELVVAAVFVLAVAAGSRALPEQWRRGPAIGVALAGGLIAAFVAVLALRDGLRALVAPGPIWHSELGSVGVSPDGWQAPVALLLLAVAAAVILPRPFSYDAAGACVALATVAVPAAFGLPWWSTIVIDAAVATAYGIAAVLADDARAGRTRAAVAAAVAAHAIGAGLVRPWTTALALAFVAGLGLLVAVIAKARFNRTGRRDTLRLGGAGLAVTLAAAPGAAASAAAAVGAPAQLTLGLGMATAVAGLVAVAVARRSIRRYLPYASAGLAVGATSIAVAALPTGGVAGCAAVAVVIGVCAELIREHTTLPRDPSPVYRSPRRWMLRPPMGAIAATALPNLLAIAALAPLLWAALTTPFLTLNSVWQGPPPELGQLHERVDASPADVLAAVLLTLAAVLAAAGFRYGRAGRPAPVVLPGLGVTLLVAPLGLRLGWPAVTLAALTVFAVLMLGVALTPPPAVSGRTVPVRASRVAAFVVALAAGGAGLAGSLATKPLTLLTLGGATAVGVTAALAGRTALARIMGWLFAAAAAQAFVLTGGLAAGWDRAWSAFGVLIVGAALVIASATLPRLGRALSRTEAVVVEYSGHAAAVLAALLAMDSTRHLAAVLAAWGAVLGIASTRRGRSEAQRRVMFWTAIGCETVAWWLLMWVADVGMVEAYTLPFAALTLLIGVLELRRRPELGSWTAYGPALISAFVPTLVIVLTTDTSALRQGLLLLAAVGTLIAGSVRRQRAPVVVGSAVTTIVALNALVLIGPWLILVPLGLVLLYVGATNEKRRRDMARLRGAIKRMR
ncbi:SCO7613 C-terminal domain-containing membrane protein [Pilimelia columellifera]|uniref:Permease n=1 Tax=Pilimelia columellifera subsp. columellifera TaxID=706583 RepID=A0ABP6AWC7_9ACTN